MSLLFPLFLSSSFSLFLLIFLHSLRSLSPAVFSPCIGSDTLLSLPPGLFLFLFRLSLSFLLRPHSHPLSLSFFSSAFPRPVPSHSSPLCLCHQRRLLQHGASNPLIPPSHSAPRILA